MKYNTTHLRYRANEIVRSYIFTARTFTPRTQALGPSPTGALPALRTGVSALHTRTCATYIGGGWPSGSLVTKFTFCYNPVVLGVGTSHAGGVGHGVASPHTMTR